MRIVIDLQGAQTKSRFREVGRYSLSLAQAIVRNKGRHDVIVALSDLFPDTIEPIRKIFDGLLPQANIRVWNAPGPVRECEPENSRRRKIAELIREAFLASLRPDIVHITSLFEGYDDDAVTSIRRFDQSTPVSVTLYDPIPMEKVGHYLKSNPIYEQYYLRKVNHLKHASLLLSVSESARQEGVMRFGLSPASVVNVSIVADQRFHPILLSQQDSDSMLAKYSIIRPFLLYSGDFEEQMNLTLLIRAYARLRTQLRTNHQLVIAGKLEDANVLVIKQEAIKAGLSNDEIVITGYVNDEELVKLYNLSKLCILPLRHTGLALQPLEAMMCRRAVIGVSARNVLEVVGRKDTLFDSPNESSIAEKLDQVLINDTFRKELEDYGLKRAEQFSWDKCAENAIESFERFHADKKSVAYPVNSRKPKLAYVSPLPPAHTGIADYSAELLPELALHYEIEVIVDQESVSDPWINANLPIRNKAWFCSNVGYYDRVLYHFGNSPLHKYMFDLLEEIPGVVVLHDFFLSHVIAYLDENRIVAGLWNAQLYYSHSYTAVVERQRKETPDTVLAYPCNLSVLQNAQGIIVHSETSRHMANQWYGNKSADEWIVIPSPNALVHEINHEEARRRLNLESRLFIACCFGMLGQTKLNKRLIEAFLESKLKKWKDCILIFVGENPGGMYGEALLEKIYSNGMEDRIRITGRVDPDTYGHYLDAADIAIQLRTFSRGETSKAVLDCMSHGLATIVNAHGSMMDLPDNSVWKLPDEFSSEQLVSALDALWGDQKLRQRLGDEAREYIRSRHAPDICASRFANAIEHFHNNPINNTLALTDAIGEIIPTSGWKQEEIQTLAQSITQSIPSKPSIRQLLVDVSAIAVNDRKDGIHRVVRSILREWLVNPPNGFRVEPVYATPSRSYRYARCFTMDFLGCPLDYLHDEPIEYRAGDIFFVLDLHHHIGISQQETFQRLRRYGVSVLFLVHDLLPIQRPEFFPEGMEERHTQWLKVVAQCDGAICVSKAVADELKEWIDQSYPYRKQAFKISWSHHGADIESSVPTMGLMENANDTLKALKTRPTFLMVGTIEPRKGYIQTLEAFEKLWHDGIDLNLIIVGGEGWKDLPNEMRRNIPIIVNRLHHHPELGKRLFWLEGISDEYLDKVYANSTCLIAASEGEGFGLPLIEAAQHKLPIIARDIPIFREVAGDFAYYFSGKEAADLATAIEAWLAMYKIGTHPHSDNLPWLTWHDSAQQLMRLIQYLRQIEVKK